MRASRSATAPRAARELAQAPPAALERGVLGEAVGEHGHRVAGGLVPVHGDPVERSGRRPRRSDGRSASAAIIASVARKQNMVARCGSSMPTPLAMPPIVTGPPADLDPERRLLGHGVRGHDGLGGAPAPLRRQRLHQLGQRRADLVHGQRLADDAGGRRPAPAAAGIAQQLADDARHLAGVLARPARRCTRWRSRSRPGWPGPCRPACAPATRARARPSPGSW